MSEVLKRPASTVIRVLIVEEQEVLRRGLLAIASSIPEVEACAVTTVVIDGLGRPESAADADVTLITTPTLLSIERQGVPLELLRPVVVILPSPDPRELEIATQRHADGYIMQAELTFDSLRPTLLKVREGGTAISGEMAQQLLHRMRDHGTTLVPPSHLSSRESEVLTLLVGGASNKEIAKELNISIHGVKRHVSSLLSRFQSPNRVHLVSRILRSGRVPSHEAGR